MSEAVQLEIVHKKTAFGEVALPDNGLAGDIGHSRHSSLVDRVNSTAEIVRRAQIRACPVVIGSSHDRFAHTALVTVSSFVCFRTADIHCQRKGHIVVRRAHIVRQRKCSDRRSWLRRRINRSSRIEQ